MIGNSPEVLLAAVSFPPLFSNGFSTIHLTDVGAGLALNTKLAVASLVAIGVDNDNDLTMIKKLSGKIICIPEKNVF